MIYTKIYSPPPINRKEVLRYASSPKGTDEINALVDECIEETTNSFAYRLCYEEFDVSLATEFFGKYASQTLTKYLDGCKSFVLFAATVGADIDRKIARESKASPSKAYILNALAAERIESLCNLFCSELKTQKAKENLCAKPRISTGFGDMPLDMQKDIFRILDCPRKIGVSLGESMLMTPRKSVTAIVGMY